MLLFFCEPDIRIGCSKGGGWRCNHVSMRIEHSNIRDAGDVIAVRHTRTPIATINFLQDAPLVAFDPLVEFGCPCAARAAPICVEVHHGYTAGAAFALFVTVYPTQKMLWKIDMENKRKAEE